MLLLFYEIRCVRGIDMLYRKGLILLFLILFSAGCSHPAEKTKQPEKEFARKQTLVEMKVATTEDMDSLDPVKINSPLEFQIAQSVYDSLILFDTVKGTYQPVLADRFFESPDGNGLIFDIKKDIKFQDGTLLDAHAVKASLERWLASYSPPQLSPVERIEVLDDYSLQVTWRRDKEELLAALSGAQAAILSPTMLENPQFSTGSYFNPAAVKAGTGPYFVQEWVAGQWLTLAANRHYFGKMPPVKRWEIKLKVPPEDALLDLRGGKLDMVQGLDPELIDWGHDLGLDDILKINELNAGLYLKLNNNSFKEPVARTALAGLIDKGQVSLNLKGLHLPMATYLPFSLRSERSVPGEVYPSGAAKLLELELADLTWAAAAGITPAIFHAVLDEITGKGIKLDAKEQGRAADLQFILWTMPFNSPRARLTLWQAAGVSTDNWQVPWGMKIGSAEYISEMEEKLRESGQLIPLLSLRQVLYVEGDGIPRSPRGYLDLAAFRPRENE